MLFLYKAKSKDGVVFEGSMDMADRFALMAELKSRGQVPVSIIEKRGSLINVQNISKNLFARVKMSEQILFTKNLSGMLHAGLSLYRAISVLEKQTKNPAMSKILLALGAEIDGGGTLSSGLEKFPKVFSKLTK